MILVVFEIRPRQGATPATAAKAWVNTRDPAAAETLAAQKLQDAGYEILGVIENMPTEKGDYFAPCKSLDAFELALKEGSSILYD